MIKTIAKLGTIVNILVNTNAANGICNLKYSILREIPVVFRNGSSYDYHFIIKELAKEFEGEFNCLG